VTILVQWLIDWPRRVAGYLGWLAPLFARITVGYVFLLSGWGKLNNLPQVTENFVGWGIPLPQLLAPFVSGIEFFGGLFLLRRSGLRSIRSRRCSVSMSSSTSHCFSGWRLPAPVPCRSITGWSGAWCGAMALPGSGCAVTSWWRNNSSLPPVISPDRAGLALPNSRGLHPCHRSTARASGR